MKTHKNMRSRARSSRAVGNVVAIGCISLRPRTGASAWASAGWGGRSRMELCLWCLHLLVQMEKALLLPRSKIGFSSGPFGWILMAGAKSGPKAVLRALPKQALFKIFSTIWSTPIKGREYKSNSAIQLTTKWVYKISTTFYSIFCFFLG